MGTSNYEITKKNMSVQFLNYDQNRMIEKYALNYDQTYLYLDFVGKPYRINRRNGLVERIEADASQTIEAGYNEAMSIYDVLCYARDDSSLSGFFCPTNSLPGIVRTGAFQPGGDFFQKEKRYFDSRTEMLRKACEMLGGIPEGKGDAAYRIQVFPFLPALFQFWNSDEDFDAEIRFFWDKNVLEYMHYETLWFVMSHIVERLKEETAKLEQGE